MSAKLTLDIIKQLPKAELHQHLDGSVRPSTIIRLAREQGVELPTFVEAELQKLVGVDETCQSLVEYLRGFDITLKVLQRAYAITQAMFEVCEDAYKDGVRYLEVRFSPILHLQEGLSQGAVMEAVCEGRAMAMNRYPITVGILVCAMRQLDSETTATIAEVAWRYRNKGVVGFDLAGPESGFSSRLHRKAFDIVRKRCVNCTLHSGEAAGWESVKDSILYCGATRIGHGVALKENKELVDFVAAKRIAIECCPTSNLHTKAITKITDHPIREYFDHGIVVVPCTDNTTVSNVRLSEEYMLLHEKYNFKPAEIVKLVDYGFSAAFLPATDKHRLRADMVASAIMVLKKNGFDVIDEIAKDTYYAPLGIDYTALGWKPSATTICPHMLCRKEKELDAAVVKALPKCDLHCRLDGSLPTEFIFEQLVATNQPDLQTLFGKDKPEVKAFGEMLSKLETSRDEADRGKAKKLTILALQSKKQIETALEIILKRAVEDNVFYLELVIRPLSHTRGELKTAQEVVTVVSEKINSFIAANKTISVGIILNATSVLDDPLTFHDLAVLAVAEKAKKNSLIAGVGFFGAEPPNAFSMKFFQKTFDLLKENRINVDMASGYTNGEDIVDAIHRGGAARISGAFALHSRPAVMTYMAMNNIPVEIGYTPRMKYHTRDVFSGNLFNILLENSIPLVFCTFRSNGDLASSRTDSLLAIARECKMSFADLVKLLSNGFQHNFREHAPRECALKEFWSKVAVVAKEHGFETVIAAQSMPGVGL